MLRNMTTIYIIFKNKMLLLYRVGSRVVQPSWCGIGGHFEKGELNNPKACVLRELFEETGITVNDIGTVDLKYELQNTEIDINECDEGTLEWVNMDEVLDREMPFTAKECLKHYLSIGKDNNKLYAGIASENGVDFIELKEF